MYSSLFKNDLLKIKGIKNVSASSGMMGKETYWTNGALPAKRRKNKGMMTMYNMGVDYDFIPSFGLELEEYAQFLQRF